MFAVTLNDSIGFGLILTLFALYLGVTPELPSWVYSIKGDFVSLQSKSWYKVGLKRWN